MGGIVLFAYEDGFKASEKVDSIVGVLLSVGAAVGAAFYKVYIYIYSIPTHLLAYQHTLFCSVAIIVSDLERMHVDIV